MKILVSFFNVFSYLAVFFILAKFSNFIFFECFPAISEVFWEMVLAILDPDFAQINSLPPLWHPPASLTGPSNGVSPGHRAEERAEGEGAGVGGGGEDGQAGLLQLRHDRVVGRGGGPPPHPQAWAPAPQLGQAAQAAWAAYAKVCAGVEKAAARLTAASGSSEAWPAHIPPTLSHIT